MSVLGWLLACGPSTPEEATTISQLEKFELSALTELSIRDKGFGPEVATSLVENATSLKVLDASGNLLGATGAATLASLSLESLHLGPGRIWVEGNRIGSKGARGLLAAPDGTLVELDLSKNQIHGDAFEVVNHPLVTLVVDSNEVGDEGCIAIARIPGLKKLHMGWSGVGDACAAALASHATLEELLLSSNDLGDEGAIALSKMPSLKTLYVSNNQITDVGARALLGLERLNLDGNPLTDLDGIQADFEGEWLSIEML